MESRWSGSEKGEKINQFMTLTKSEQSFLKEIYEKGSITAREQETYIVNSGFYKVITRLRNKKLIQITTLKLKNSDKRISIYELTVNGLVIIKILLGEDY